MFNIKMENEAVVVFGNVNSDKVESVMNALNEIALSKGTYGLKLVLVDSICITSFLICELVEFQDSHSYLRVVVGNQGLYDLLDSLDLISRLKVSYKPTKNY